MYSDEEQIVSRNYLLFIEDRFKNQSGNESSQTNESSNLNTTFGSSDQSSNTDSSTSEIKYKPADKLIIKAKVYILEILEVKKLSKERERERF